jgi:hypothetical protein
MMSYDELEGEENRRTARGPERDRWVRRDFRRNYLASAKRFPVGRGSDVHNFGRTLTLLQCVASMRAHCPGGQKQIVFFPILYHI